MVTLYQLIANTIGLGVLLLLFASSYLFISPLLIQRMNLQKYIFTRRFLFGLILVALYFMLTFFLYKNSQSVMINANTIQDVVKDTLNNDNEEPKVEIQQFKALK